MALLPRTAHTRGRRRYAVAALSSLTAAALTLGGASPAPISLNSKSFSDHPAPSPPPPQLSHTARVDGALHLLRHASQGGAIGALRRWLPAGLSEVCVIARGTPPAWLHPGPHPHRTHAHIIWSATLSWPQLDRLAADPAILQLDACWAPLRLSPLEATTEQLGLDEVDRRIWPLTGDRTGRGEVVAVVDSGIDVLHPSLFAADGGVYDWIDVDGDGALTQGVDGVDLNGDGVVGRNERLRVLKAVTVLDFGSGEVSGRDEPFDTGRDWLYLDRNGDGERNVGEARGFLEVDPAYGEPIFVVDDINGDGMLGEGERLVQLKTSKVRRVLRGSREYRRGADLIASSPSGGVTRALHGTAVAGIVVGGAVGFHRRVGVAPEAELVVGAFNVGVLRSFDGSVQVVEDDAAVLATLNAAREEGARVLLHEWNNPFTRPLDGSTNLEAALMAARQEGMIQVVPSGNLATSRKHMTRTLAAGARQDVGVEVGEGWRAAEELLPYSVVLGTLQWAGEAPVSLLIEAPDGKSLELGDGAMVTRALAGAQLVLTREVTSLGNTLVRFYLSASDERESLMRGQWRLGLVSRAAQDVEVLGRVTDLYSGWRDGVRWSVAQQAGTASSLSYPACMEGALVVGATAGRVPSPGGEVVRDYSGRGPCLTGAVGVSVIAPDDPFVPVGLTQPLVDSGWARGWYGVFGGTSGASAHVAGGVALLFAARSTWDATQVEHALQASATREGLTGEAPSVAWGAGRLNLSAALGDEPTLSAPIRQEVRALARRDGDDVVIMVEAPADFELRYDVGYNGVWDTAWGAPAELRLEGVSREGVVKVVARQGSRHGATLVRYTAHSPSPDSPDMAPPPTHDMDSTHNSPLPPRSGPGCACATGGSSPARPSSSLLLLAALGVALGVCKNRQSCLE